jgi:hypothetical protein
MAGLNCAGSNMAVSFGPCGLILATRAGLPGVKQAPRCLPQTAHLRLK